MKKIGIFSVAATVFFISLLVAATARSQIYINNFPEDLVIQEGEPLDVPIFFAEKAWAGLPAEFFVWKEDKATLEKSYLDQTGWVPFADFTEMRPLGSVDPMIEYAYILWRASDDTWGMSSFNLGICIDASMSGQVTADADCTQRAVIIAEPVSTAVCDGVVASPTSISKTMTRGQTETVSISVKDACGKPADFSATSAQSWIALTNQTGTLGATLDTASLSPGNYSGVIAISSGGKSVPVNVALVVKSPGFDLGGGGTCTPASVALWPSPVSLSAASGGTQTAAVSVKNNCGSSLSYTASVTSGSSWLGVSSSGNGTLTVTAKAAGMQAGSYTGTAQVNAAGYSPSALSVTLTVTGACTPSSAVLTPSSISQTALVGQNPSAVSVTVRDNCGTDLSYTVNAVSATYTPAAGGSAVTWITSPVANSQGTGSLGVTFNASSLPAGTYTGSMTVTPSTGGSKTIPVSLTISSSTTSNSSIKDVADGSTTYADFQANETKFFRYMSTASSSQNYPLIIAIANQYTQNGVDSDMIIKYAGPNCEDGPPTMSDYNLVKQYVAANGNSVWSIQAQAWQPARVRNDLYYTIRQSSFETVQIYGSPDNPKGCYYIMIVNTLSSPETYVRLTVSDMDSRAQ